MPAPEAALAAEPPQAAPAERASPRGAAVPIPAGVRRTAARLGAAGGLSAGSLVYWLPQLSENLTDIVDLVRRARKGWRAGSEVFEGDSV